jgi:hypothetical protein
MRDQAARSESRILGLPFHAQVGQTHQAGETAPGFGDGRSSTLSQLAETNCAVFPLQHHFHPNVYRKDERDLNAVCSTTIQVLNLCDKKLWYLQ